MSLCTENGDSIIKGGAVACFFSDRLSQKRRASDQQPIHILNHCCCSDHADCRLADSAQLSQKGAEAVLALFRDFDRVIGCFEVDAVRESAAVPAEVTALAEARAAARKAKDFAESDRLRDELAKLGWAVKDVPGGAWELKKL